MFSSMLLDNIYLEVTSPGGASHKNPPANAGD